MKRISPSAVGAVSTIFHGRSAITVGFLHYLEFLEALLLIYELF